MLDAIEGARTLDATDPRGLLEVRVRAPGTPRSGCMLPVALREGSVLGADRVLKVERAGDGWTGTPRT